MELESLRRKIDAIDREILARLNARARLSAQVGREKRRTGADVYVPQREKQILRRLTADKNSELPAAAVRAIFREIISASTARQKQLNIAFPVSGDAGAQVAALLNFGASARYLRCRDPEAVMAALSSGAADYAVLSSAGDPQARKRQSAGLNNVGVKTVAMIRPARNLGLPARYCVLARV